MDQSKIGILKDITRGLLVSNGGTGLQAVTPTLPSFSQIAGLFSRGERYDDEEYEEEYVYYVKEDTEKITGIREATSTAKKIYSALQEISLFKENTYEYRKALNEYHSIVEARRHREILNVFAKEIKEERKLSYGVSKLSEKKSRLPVAIAATVAGAGSLMVLSAAQAKEVQNVLDFKDIDASLNEIDAQMSDNILIDLSEKATEIEKSLNNIFKKSQDMENASIKEVQEKITDTGDELERMMRRSMQYGENRVSTTAVRETPPVSFGEGRVSTTAVRESPPAGTSVERFSFGVTRTAPTPASEISAMAEFAGTMPPYQTGEGRVSTTAVRETPPVGFGEDKVSTTAVRETPPVGFGEDKVSTTAVRETPPVGFGEDKVSTTAVREAPPAPAAPAPPPLVIPGPRRRPDEAAILKPPVSAVPVPTERQRPSTTRLPPSEIFGGFPYVPILDDGVKKFGATVEGEKVIEFIAATEGGLKGENQMNIPSIPHALQGKMSKYDKENKTNTLRETKSKIYSDSLILKGKIDVTTGKPFDKNLSEMTIEEVMSLGQRRINYYKGLGIVASSAAGKYGFISSAIQDHAERVFGGDWKKQIFNEETQDRLQVSLFRTIISEAIKRKDPLSSALIYMQHFFGPYSLTPGKILKAKDETKMSDLMTRSEISFNRQIAALTVGEFKRKRLLEKGFSFDVITPEFLLTEPPKVPPTPETPTPRTPPAPQRPRGSQRTRPTSSLMQFNNNVAVYNTNRIMAPVQQNNNPGLA